MKSTPGCCSLRALGTTNGQILGWDGVSEYDHERLAIVKASVKQRFDSLLRGEAVADPLNMFIKREPVKLAKDRLGAYRLISGVSLIDTFVDRILFGWFARVVVDTAAETPSMIGWSPMRGGWNYIRWLFKHRPVVCLDKSAWDWTVLEWMVRDFTSFILQLPVSPPGWWVDMVKLRMKLLYHVPVYQFKDGTQVCQNEWGIQKSGSFLTIIFNTVMQYMVHVRASPGSEHDVMVILGDDTAQQTPRDLQDYVSRIEKLGPKLKGAKVQHWVEFAGFAYFGKSVVPAYWKKHLFKLRYAENLLETLRSYQLLYSHDAVMFEYLEREVCEIDVGSALPRVWCREVMDSWR